MDVEKGKVAQLNMWEDKPTLEAALMYPGRYVISTVHTKDNQPILAASTDRLHNIAGKYVGKDDPICIIRTQKDFPATEEVGAAFSNPHLVAGNTRGSHHMPLMPVKINSSASINFAIPIVSALVFSMHNGKLIGPVDGFSTADWDYIRTIAVKRAIAIRRQGKDISLGIKVTISILYVITTFIIHLYIQNMVKKIQILIVGNNENGSTPNLEKVAYQTGIEVARAEAVLITGGLGGVMKAACRGAKDGGGLTVGIIPQNDPSFANEFCDIVIPSGFGLARDFLTALSADGVIIIGGASGTLSETCAAYMYKS